MDTIQSTEEFPWKKNLYIVWVTQFIAMIGMNACVPFLPLYIRQLGVTDPSDAKRWSGFIFAAPFFLSFLVTPLWGWMGDKYGRKIMVVRAIFGLMISMFLMGLAQNIWHLFFLRVLQGCISGFVAANLSLVSAFSPRQHSGYALGLLQTSSSAAVTIGPFFGGLFADVVGIRESFLFVTVLCLISGVIVITMVQEKKNKPSHQNRKLSTNISIVWKDIKLRNFLLYITLCQSGISFTTPILAYYLEKLHAPSKYLGTITGIMIGLVGFLMTIFTPMWGKKNDTHGCIRTLRIALPLLIIATFAQSFVPHYLYLFPLRFMIGIFSGAMLPTLYAALNKSSPPEIQGSVMGFASSAAVLGNLIGPIVCSWTASHIGIESAFIMGGIFLGIVYLSILTQQKE